MENGPELEPHTISDESRAQERDTDADIKNGPETQDQREASSIVRSMTEYALSGLKAKLAERKSTRLEDNLEKEIEEGGRLASLGRTAMSRLTINGKAGTQPESRSRRERHHAKKSAKLIEKSQEAATEAKRLRAFYGPNYGATAGATEKAERLKAKARKHAEKLLHAKPSHESVEKTRQKVASEKQKASKNRHLQQAALRDIWEASGVETAETSSQVIDTTTVDTTMTETPPTRSEYSAPVFVHKKGELFPIEKAKKFEFMDMPVHPNFPDDKKTRPTLVTVGSEAEKRLHFSEARKKVMEQRRQKLIESKRITSPVEIADVYSVPTEFLRYFTDSEIASVDAKIYDTMSDVLSSMPDTDDLPSDQKIAIRRRVITQNLPPNTPDNVIDAFVEAHHIAFLKTKNKSSPKTRE